MAQYDEDDRASHFMGAIIAPHGLEFRGRIVQRALSGFVELGQRDAYEANQERVLVWLLRHPLIASVDRVCSGRAVMAPNGQRSH